MATRSQVFVHFRILCNNTTTNAVDGYFDVDTHDHTIDQSAGKGAISLDRIANEWGLKDTDLPNMFIRKRENEDPHYEKRILTILLCYLSKRGVLKRDREFAWNPTQLDQYIFQAKHMNQAGAHYHPNVMFLDFDRLSNGFNEMCTRIQTNTRNLWNSRLRSALVDYKMGDYFILKKIPTVQTQLQGGMIDPRENYLWWLCGDTVVKDDHNRNPPPYTPPKPGRPAPPGRPVPPSRNPASPSRTPVSSRSSPAATPGISRNFTPRPVSPASPGRSATSANPLRGIVRGLVAVNVAATSPVTVHQANTGRQGSNPGSPTGTLESRVRELERENDNLRARMDRMERAFEDRIKALEYQLQRTNPR